jgi:hypothetical protein
MVAGRAAVVVLPGDGVSSGDHDARLCPEQRKSFFVGPRASLVHIWVAQNLGTEHDWDEIRAWIAKVLAFLFAQDWCGGCCVGFRLPRAG